MPDRMSKLGAQTVSGAEYCINAAHGLEGLQVRQGKNTGELAWVERKWADVQILFLEEMQQGRT